MRALRGTAQSEADRMPVKRAKDALTRLPATGEAGFEGLVAEALSAQLGASLRLCSSGRQHGRDMGGGTIAAEAKRYSRAKLNANAVAGEIGIAKRRTPNLSLWILATTTVVSRQDAEEIENAARQAKVDLGLFDWSGGSPRLLVLLARNEDATYRWFCEHAPGEWAAIAAGLTTVRALPDYDRVSRELEETARGIGLIGKLRETLIRAARAAVSDSSGVASIQMFGQRIDFAGTEAFAVERVALNRRLAQAFSGAQRIVSVIGHEGVGKTWAVVQFALEFAPDRPLLFLSSALIEEAERRGWDSVTLAAEALMRCLRVADECDARFMDDRFVAGLLGRVVEFEAGGLRPFVVLDGYAERHGGRWPTLIADIRRDLCVDYGATIWVRTARQSG